MVNNKKKLKEAIPPSHSSALTIVSASCDSPSSKAAKRLGRRLHRNQTSYVGLLKIKLKIAVVNSCSNLLRRRSAAMKKGGTQRAMHKQK